MKKRTILTIVLLFLALLSACSGEERANAGDVVKEYEKLLNAGDINALMALFMEGASFTTFEKDVLIGKEDIREYLQSKIDEGVQIETSLRSVHTGNRRADYGEQITIGGTSIRLEAILAITTDGKIQTLNKW
jgi:hypothetical protein